MFSFYIWLTRDRNFHALFDAQIVRPSVTNLYGSSKKRIRKKIRIHKRVCTMHKLHALMGAVCDLCVCVCVLLFLESSIVAYMTLAVS